MKKKSIFREKQDHETVQHHSQSSETVKSFESVEALIRHDAGATRVPETLSKRLHASIGNPPKGKSWWRRFLKQRG